MSLATRCSSCGTVFRVVQDQLKVSEGWVRCGRCNEVFSALEGLFDLERDPPPAWPAAAAEPEPHLAGNASYEPDLPPTVDESDPDLIERIDAELFGERPPITDRAEPEFAAPSEEPIGHGFEAPDESAAEPPRQEPLFADAAPAPEFVRHAERLARWQQPRTRYALVAAAVVLLLALALQWSVHFRDLLAARWPVARPALAAWCAGFGCRLDAPHRIEDVSVENTTLTRAAGPDVFRLTVTLRNRGNLTLALPSIDLSLTDSGGQLIARRALAPSDFRAASPLLPAGAESALQLLLTAGTPRVTGYTVEIFYP
jgi:predicted Zn finger-like uncharacterized protein